MALGDYTRDMQTRDEDLQKALTISCAARTASKRLSETLVSIDDASSLDNTYLAFNRVTLVHEFLSMRALWTLN